MDNYYTERLAKYLAGLRYEDIPPTVIEHAKLTIIDGLGCGLFGSTLPWSKKVIAMIRELETDGKASIWGTSYRCSPAQAAMANGCFVQGFELDDLHTVGTLHGSSSILPASMALAQHLGGASGRDFLTAVVAGWELGARVGICLGPRALIQGWHTPALNGTFAAAAAAAKMLHLDEERMVHCIGHAGTQAAGLMAVQFSAEMKRLHAGKAALSGVYSALLAQRGFTGITNVFEAEYGGFLTTFTGSKDRFDITKLTDRLGEHFYTSQASFKVYATNGSVQTSLDAIRKLRQQHPLPPEQVEKVTIWTSEATYEHVGWKYVPNSITTAQFNIQYCVAVMLLEGDAFIDQFKEEKLRNPTILGLVNKVEVIHDPAIDAEGAASRHKIRMEVKLKDGQVLRTDLAHRRGSESAPLTRQELVDKFRRLASTAIGQGQMDRILGKISALDTVADVRSLIEDLTVK